VHLLWLLAPRRWPAAGAPSSRWSMTIRRCACVLSSA